MNKRLFSFRDYTLRTKLLLSIISVTIVSVAIFGYFAYTRAQQLQTFLTGQLQTTVQVQSEQQLKSTVQNQANNADQLLSEITLAVKGLADYRGAIYSQASILGKGSYWDGHTKLSKLPAGQYVNSLADTFAVFIPNVVPVVDDALISDLNVSANLDFSAPGILKNHPNMVALYYMSSYNYVLYYPNFDQSVLPPELSALQLPWYTIVLPQNDPERKIVWSAPYQDPAGTGLIVTDSAPVYDQNGTFHGVMAADVQLSKLTKNISAIKIAKSGFAFLIDHAGHIIAMPEPGYALLGLQPEVVPVNETPKLTLLEQGPAEFQDAVHRMTLGEEGLSTVKIAGVEYDVVYTPLPSVGYSLGAIVPTAEMKETFLTARRNIESETQHTLNFAAIILMVLLLAAAGISFLLSQYITRPLAALTHVANQISSGNFDMPARVESKDELGSLAGAFNNMTVRVRETMAALAERATELAQVNAQLQAEMTERKQAEVEREHLQQEIIEAQQRAIAELSTPVIPIMDRIIVMPLIGSIDSLRARDVTRSLLAGITQHRAKVVILDVTGVGIMDTGIVNHLNKTIQAARLKGAQTIVTGVSDAVAEAIVDLGIDWSGVTTLADLQSGLMMALNSLGVKLNR